MGLRSLLLGSKFLFILILAKICNIRVVGIYGILQATAIIFSFVIGAELHTEVARRISGSNSFKKILSQHISWVFLIGVLFAPLVIVGLIQLKVVEQLNYFIYFLILLGEALSLEVGRYLLTLFRPIASNILQFIRGGIWIPAALSGIYFYDADPVGIILIFWCIGLWIAIIYGLVTLGSERPTLLLPNFKWLVITGKKSFYNYLISLVNQVQSYGDRYVVGYFFGDAILGAYLFYLNIAASIQIFSQTGSIGVITPHILISAREMNFVKFKYYLRKMLNDSIVIIMGVSLLLYVVSNYLIVGYKDIGITQYQYLLPWMMVLYSFLSVAQIAQIGLYALRMDRKNLLTNIALSLVLFGGYFIFLPYLGIIGVLISGLVVSVLSMGYKWRLLRIMTPS